jgi:hypothetical protein
VSVEYVLLMALFVLLLMGSITKGPYGAFENAGPKLGARVERHLITGDGFKPGGQLNQWSQ